MQPRATTKFQLLRRESSSGRVLVLRHGGRHKVETGFNPAWSHGSAGCVGGRCSECAFETPSTRVSYREHRPPSFDDASLRLEQSENLAQESIRFVATVDCWSRSKFPVLALPTGSDVRATVGRASRTNFIKRAFDRIGPTGSTFGLSFAESVLQ